MQFLKPRLIHFAVYLLVGLCSISAYAINCRAWLKRDGHSEFSNYAATLFTSETAEEILYRMHPLADKIIGDSKPLDHEKIEALFTAYMQIRMEYLTQDVRVKVQKSLDDLKVKRFKPNRFKKEIYGGAREIYGHMQLTISMPDYLFGTLIDYAVRVHELEHIIQIYSVGTGSSVQYLFPNFAIDRHTLEAGAMKAEAIFLLTFPKEVLKSFKAKLLSDSKSSKLAKELIDRALAADDADQYLQNNWNQGRYSLEQIRLWQLQNIAVFSGGVVPLVILSHIFGF